MKLSSSSLRSLSSRVAVPSYNRGALKAGILHLGVGNFHRAHMATYLDDLFQKDFDGSKDWGIIGAGILHFDQTKRDLLESQDWMQTLVAQDAERADARIIGSMIDFLPVSVAAIQEALAAENIKIVSLTVTEGGYFIKDGKFDVDHPQIQHDIQNPDQPQTIFGVLVKALKQRRENGQKPFTVMSCDNIPHNGHVVRAVVTQFAEKIDADLAKWIDQNVGFPNSMVDRIAPASTPEQAKFVSDQYGLEDKAPVFCEPFRQWVIEDKFSEAGRPNLDQLENVRFVDDVTPYEFAKLRILNGGHASLCYPGALLGLQYVHETMAHPTISAFLDALETNEIIPTVGKVPDVDLQEYWKIIQGRFSNPTLNDTLRRNCFDGASRQPKFVIPVAKDNLEADRPIDGLAIVSAIWCRYCQGIAEKGETIEDNDPQWARLQEVAIRAKVDPKVWLSELVDVYGTTVSTNPTFVDSFCKSMHSITNNGVEATMQNYISLQA